MTDYTIKRGPWGKPWITRDFSALDYGPDPDFPADRPHNGFLYDRVSDLSGNLDTKENLSPYHQCQAVMGMMLDRALAVQFKALMSEHGMNTWSEGKKEAKALLSQARMRGGEEHKSGMGSGFHRYTVLRDKDQDIEFPTPEFEPWLDVYSKAMERFKVIGWEGFVVIDDLENPDSPEDVRSAGSYDKLVEDQETGEILVADVKTGASDDQWLMKPTIQVAGYAHGQHYDQETGRRWAIHENVSLTRGLMIHVPFNGGGTPECLIHPLDLQEGWRLAKMSKDITQARKMKAYKRDVLARVKASAQ